MSRVERLDLTESALFLHPILHGRTHCAVAKALDINRRQLSRATSRKAKRLGDRRQGLVDKVLKRLSTILSRAIVIQALQASRPVQPKHTLIPVHFHRFSEQAVDVAQSPIGHRLTVTRYIGGEIDQKSDIRRTEFSRLCNNRPAQTVPNENHRFALGRQGERKEIGIIVQGQTRQGLALGPAAWEIRGHHPMARSLQDRRQFLPTPTAMPSPMYQNKGAHCQEFSRQGTSAGSQITKW